MNLLALIGLKALLATQTPSYIRDAEKAWKGLAEVSIESKECGEENAYFYPADNTVVMCSELYAKPELAVFVFNHEMGHAFMYQHEIPNSERGADELALLTSTPDQITAGAKWFLDMGGEHRDGDAHQGNMDRAASFLCYLDGIDDQPQSRACRMYAQSIDENWGRMMVLVHLATATED